VAQAPVRNAAQAPAADPSSNVGVLFGLPSITRPTEQPDNNDGVALTLASGSQTDFIFPANFKQTDIMKFWDLEFAITQTYAANTDVITASQYFPYSWISQLILNFQNQFDTVNLTFGGIDAFLFSVLRPMRKTNLTDFMDDQTMNQNGYNTQPNLQTADQITVPGPGINAQGSQYTLASPTVKFNLELPASVPFDRYFECDPKGKPLHADPIRAVVSPQYMAGTNRIVQPRVKMQPGFASTYDNGPAVISTSGAGTHASFSGSATLGIQRVGWYQPLGPADSPRVFNWQYRRSATKFTQSGVSSSDIVFPLQGQIMGVFARFFDPAANSGLGAPIPLANIKNCYIQYGSGLYRFQDNPLRAQKRLAHMRNIRLPEGVLWWDFARDEWDALTNAYVLNTMDTSGIQIHVDYTGAQSSSAYCVLGIEALTYVAML
jgi:hypothetical protein